MSTGTWITVGVFALPVIISWGSGDITTLLIALSLYALGGATYWAYTAGRDAGYKDSLAAAAKLPAVAQFTKALEGIENSLDGSTFNSAPSQGGKERANEVMRERQHGNTEDDEIRDINWPV